MPNSDLFEGKLLEHGKTIIAENAVEVLARYFVCYVSVSVGTELFDIILCQKAPSLLTKMKKLPKIKE